MENKTEILAERGGLKLVLTRTHEKLENYLITLGTHIVLGTSDYSNTNYQHKECVAIVYNHSQDGCTTTPELAKETATKMAIEWFNSLFENNE